MKKIKIFTIILLSSLCLFGCNKEEVVEEETVTEVIEDIKVDVEEQEMKITHEMTEAGKRYEEQIAELNEYYYYYYSLESNSIKGKIAYKEEEITEQVITNSILKQFTDKEILVESFQISEPEEIVSRENGVEYVKYDGEFIGYLNLSGSFQELLNEQVTPLMQWYIIQTLSNAISKNFELNKVQILSAGNNLSTLYKDYTSEDFIEFSTLAYDNLDILSEDVIELSKTIEYLNKSGYEITRQNYIDFMNSGLTADKLQITPVETEESIEEESIFEEEVIETISNDEEFEESSEIETIEIIEEETETEESETELEEEIIIIN